MSDEARGESALDSLRAPSAGESPVSAMERIDSLDVLRGFAVLGILVMNIQSFAMVGSAYMNPKSWGDLSGVNGIIWHASHVLADSKFMTLFSILFGAGIVLVSERRQSAGKSPAALHYRRMLVTIRWYDANHPRSVGRLPHGIRLRRAFGSLHA